MKKVEEVTIDLKIIKPEIIEINPRNRSKGTVLKYMVYIYCRTSQTQKGLAEVYFNVTQEQQAVNELSILFLTEIPPYTHNGGGGGPTL